MAIRNTAAPSARKSVKQIPQKPPDILMVHGMLQKKPLMQARAWSAEIAITATTTNLRIFPSNPTRTKTTIPFVTDAEASSAQPIKNRQLQEQPQPAQRMARQTARNAPYATQFFRLKISFTPVVIAMIQKAKSARFAVKRNNSRKHQHRQPLPPGNPSAPCPHRSRVQLHLTRR
jgi:hypothetical protein